MADEQVVKIKYSEQSAIAQTMRGKISAALGYKKRGAKYVDQWNQEVADLIVLLGEFNEALNK
jgi:hypothetical protein